MSQYKLFNVGDGVSGSPYTTIQKNGAMYNYGNIKDGQIPRRRDVILITTDSGDIDYIETQTLGTTNQVTRFTIANQSGLFVELREIKGSLGEVNVAGSILYRSTIIENSKRDDKLFVVPNNGLGRTIDNFTLIYVYGEPISGAEFAASSEWRETSYTEKTLNKGFNEGLKLNISCSGLITSEYSTTANPFTIYNPIVSNNCDNLIFYIIRGLFYTQNREFKIGVTSNESTLPDKRDIESTLLETPVFGAVKIYAKTYTKLAPACSRCTSEEYCNENNECVSGDCIPKCGNREYCHMGVCVERECTFCGDDCGMQNCPTGERCIATNGIYSCQQSDIVVPLEPPTKPEEEPLNQLTIALIGVGASFIGLSLIGIFIYIYVYNKQRII